jgi:hypothetical protein
VHRRHHVLLLGVGVQRGQDGGQPGPQVALEDDGVAVDDPAAAEGLRVDRTTVSRAVAAGRTEVRAA